MLTPGADQLAIDAAGGRYQTRRLHVVHLIEALGSGGAERLLYTNLKHLDPRRFRNTVVTVFPRAEHWKQPIQRLGVEVICLGCRNYRSLARGFFRLWRLLRQTRPDVLHTHLWAANVIGRSAGRLAGVSVISSAHNPEYECAALENGSSINRHKWRVARLLDRWTARLGCQRMIAVSEYVRQSTAHHLGFPLGQIELLYNPVDLGEIRRIADRGRPELFGELGLPADALVLLNVGRLSPQKGLLDAVRALAEIRRHYPVAHLVSIGATDDRIWVERVRAQVQALGLGGHVHILGSRRDVPAWLRACDLFLFPSLFEGLGIALVEAMAVGCTCVASRTGPIPEVIRHGENGWLVRPGDPVDLASAVCRLLADPACRARLGQAALETADDFHPGQAATRLAAIYKATLTRLPAAGAGRRYTLLQ